MPPGAWQSVKTGTGLYLFYSPHWKDRMHKEGTISPIIRVRTIWEVENWTDMNYLTVSLFPSGRFSQYCCPIFNRGERQSKINLQCKHVPEGPH